MDLAGFGNKQVNYLLLHEDNSARKANTGFPLVELINTLEQMISKIIVSLYDNLLLILDIGVFL